MMTTLICHDDDCISCDTRARHRRCVDCGADGIVTDCGHHAQPRPLAGSQYGGDAVCDGCEATRGRIAALVARKGAGYAPTLREALAAAREGRLWDVDTQNRGADCLTIADSADEALAEIALHEECDEAHADGAAGWARDQRWSARRITPAA